MSLPYLLDLNAALELTPLELTCSIPVFNMATLNDVFHAIEYAIEQERLLFRP